ncbi:hypothetical protein NL676_022546 [Syzygium grande]|nr:hypothetical protein NL676_022546 [Syzygium grande]
MSFKRVSFPDAFRTSIRTSVSLFVSPLRHCPSHYVIAVKLVIDLVGEASLGLDLVLVLPVLVLLVASSSHLEGLFDLVDESSHFFVLFLCMV